MLHATNESNLKEAKHKGILALGSSSLAVLAAT